MYLVARNLFRTALYAGVPTLLIWLGLEYELTWLQVLVLTLAVIAAPFFVVSSLLALRASKIAQRSSPLMFGLWVIMAATYLTAVFCCLSAVLYSHNMVKMTGPPMKNSLTVTWQYYSWNLLDSIPFLEVPNTLHWELARTFSDHLSGGLLLAYKLLVLLPIAKLVVLIAAGWVDENVKSLKHMSGEVSWIGNLTQEEMKDHIESVERPE
jgi:hypothetical protein